MRTRESDMPDEAVWAGFFEPAAVLRALGLSESCRDVVDFGCGYGTFTIPAAKTARGTVHALDIDPRMVEATRGKALAAGLANVRAVCRDFLAEGSGLADGCANFVMQLNILHAEERADMLREARRILRPSGRLAVMHWNYDARTPRGPSMSIRPRPQELRAWVEAAGFASLTTEPVDLPPFHYGWTMRPIARDTATL